MKINPFIHSRALSPDEFLGRERELRHLFSRLATRQSTAFIGQPHVGKTSLLIYLADEKKRQQHFGDQFDRDLFCYLDAQALRGVKTQAGFWRRALTPFEACLKAGSPEHLQSLKTIYGTAKENQFGTFVLEQLFNEFDSASARLVLLLDEFDDFLSHPVLNSAEFYGGLRSLGSRSKGLAIVIAARRDLERLNKLTQQFNPHGSPYFNVFTEIKFGTLSIKEFSELVKAAGNRFDQTDHEYIAAVSGRHPYLAQAAAAMLWDAHEDGLEGEERYKVAGRYLYQQAKQHFSDTWNFWTNETRKAITAVALAQIPKLVGHRRFLVKELIDDLDDYGPELEALEIIGTITEGEEGEYVITQSSFLWWLADELLRNVRDEDEFKGWLRAQELDNLLTANEREKLGNAVRKVLEVTGRGATTLIDSFAKGFGEGFAQSTLGKTA